jgi:hypothetical protein
MQSQPVFVPFLSANAPDALDLLGTITFRCASSQLLKNKVLKATNQPLSGQATERHLNHPKHC